MMAGNSVDLTLITLKPVGHFSCRDKSKALSKFKTPSTAEICVVNQIDMIYWIYFVRVYDDVSILNIIADQ